MNDLSSNILSRMPRTDAPLDAVARPSSATLFIPRDIEVCYDPATHTVSTCGLGQLDAKKKDLIEIVHVVDPLSCAFEKTNFFSPRTYIESLNPIPAHVTVQAILLTRATSTADRMVRFISNTYPYGKTGHDKFWCEETLDCIEDGPLIIMNRRVGGWDGSPERPVMELLGAGGHVPAVWIEEEQCFKSMDPTECLRKEVAEEIGLSDFSVELFGGFLNTQTAELVILYGIVVEFSQLLGMQKSAFGNYSENTDGLYLGLLDRTIERYHQDATAFAGGERAKPTNFPHQPELMKRVYAKSRSI